MTATAQWVNGAQLWGQPVLASRLVALDFVRQAQLASHNAL
jgi:hypothetical protein